jgi:hypothetical protein
LELGRCPDASIRRRYTESGTAETFASFNKSTTYFSQLCVQPFLFGHKLQFLIEKSFFLGFDDRLGAASTVISAG